MSAVTDHSRVEAELGAELVGPGMWGTVYRARDGVHYYRLIEDLSADQKADLQEMEKEPRRPRIAPVLAARLRPVDGRYPMVVEYEAGAGATLVGALAEPDPGRRVAAVGAVAQSLPLWWDALGRGLLPMPGDVVFVRDTPQLLPLPRWGPPGIESLLGEPSRALFLAPEIVRGRHAPTAGPASDLFTLGVMLLLCFATPEQTEGPRLLHRSACGVAFSPERSTWRVAFWLQKVEAVQDALRLARGLIEPDPRARSGLDPFELGARLARCPEAMKPETAVQLLRNSGRAQEALELAHAILLDDPSYDLLLLAAEISWKDLGAPLEGLSLLDKAVEADPHRGEAYAQQFTLISHLRTDIVARLAAAIDESFAERLDRTMEAAYRRLPPEDQDSRAPEVAWYLIERDRLPRANEFVYERLHDGNTLLWWKFDLMLAYAETFLRLGRLDSARQVIQQIKRGLRRVRDNESMPGEEIRGYGERLSELEIRVLERGRAP